MESVNAARLLVEQLQRQDRRLVLAESCTCGRAAAELGLIPGVSRYLCGSWVVYRAASKSNWLGLDAQRLDEISTESLACSQMLAEAALQRTEEATIVGAVTGDLGPGVSEEADGVIYIVTGLREPSGEVRWSQQQFHLKKLNRDERQLEAAQQLLLQLAEKLIR